MLDEPIAPEPTTADASVADLRTLVGNMLGEDNIQSLDEGSLRALSTVLLERMMFARQAGMSFHGARDTYEILGYNRVLSYKEYRARYMRGGLAKRIVDVYPVAVWRAGAEVYEDEDPKVNTPFEKAFADLDARLSVWSRFQRAHILAGLSTYSVMLIGVKGGGDAGDLSKELPRGNGTPDNIIYLEPFSGGGGPGGDQTTRSMAMMRSSLLRPGTTLHPTTNSSWKAATRLGCSPNSFRDGW